VDQLSLAFVKKYFPAHGEINSDDFNDLMEELAVDLTNILAALNNTVQPLIDSLPNGGRTITADDRNTSLDPITNGLDGSQLYLDMTAVSDDGPLFYNSTALRPNTIKEALSYLNQLILTHINA
jgi:hypothetical protein